MEQNSSSLAASKDNISEASKNASSKRNDNANLDEQKLLEKEENIDLIKVFEISCDDNTKYLIKLEGTSKGNLIICAKDSTNPQTKDVFSEKFSMEDLRSIDRFFRMLENAEEVINELSTLFLSNNVSIDFDNSDNLILCFQMTFNQTKKDIYLRLLKSEAYRPPVDSSKSGVDQKLIKDLYNLIDLQSRKLDVLNKQNLSLQGQVDKLQSRLDEIPLEHYKEKSVSSKGSSAIKSNESRSASSESGGSGGSGGRRKSKFNKKKAITPEDMEELLEKSMILRNEKDLNFLIWKINKNMLNKRKQFFDMKCIYRASIDGSTARDFHRLCDGQSPVLVLIKTVANKRFGGYTNCSFESSTKFKGKRDNLSFIFSLDRMRTYDIKEDENAICCFKDYGPVFYGYEYSNIFLKGNFFEVEGGVAKKGDRFQTLEDFEINDGEQTFLTKEIEVYLVELSEDPELYKYKVK